MSELEQDVLLIFGFGLVYWWIFMSPWRPSTWTAPVQPASLVDSEANLSPTAGQAQVSARQTASEIETQQQVYGTSLGNEDLAQEIALAGNLTPAQQKTLFYATANRRTPFGGVSLKA